LPFVEPPGVRRYFRITNCKKKKKKEKNINSIFFFLRHTPGGDGDRVGIREEEEEGKKRKDGND